MKSEHPEIAEKQGAGWGRTESGISKNSQKMYKVKQGAASREFNKEKE